MKTYMVEVKGRKYEVGIQGLENGAYRAIVDGKQYTISQGAGQAVTRPMAQAAPLPPQINITMPEQPQPIFNIPAPVVNVTVPKQEAPIVNIPQQAAPQVTVNVPQQPAPVVNVPQQAAPTINIPQQPAPVVNVAAPVVNVPQQERQAPPQVVVNVPEQPAPVVNIPPAEVTVNIPDINLRAGSVAKVKRDYTGKIMEITSNATVEGSQ